MNNATSVLVVLLLMASSSMLVAEAQVAVPAASAASTPASRQVALKTQAPGTAIRPVSDVATKPLWTELTSPQRLTLAPLAGAWNTINEAQKRKWLALAANYPKLSAAEQVIMTGRMSEWAALSPQQRTQARLNFAETQRLAPDEKKAKWETYQALPADEKRRLAAEAPARVPGTAAALKPVPQQKLATVPVPARDARTPRITSGSPAESGFPPPQAGSSAAPVRAQPN